ncbi:MAG TPA: DUF4386 family protein [Solirubrobacterales bacterium]|nr:DUF4386 family protein [Solirubrobacterales bacterium]
MAPLTGVLFIVLAVVGFAVAGEPPDTDEGTQAIVDFYSDNEGSVVAGSIIQGLAAVAFLFFAGVLRTVLREGPGARGTLAAISFAGAVVFATGVAIDGTINLALAEEVDTEGFDPVAMQAMLGLWNNDWLPFAVGVLTFMLASGLAILRTGVLPSWLGWAAVAIAILAGTPIGFVAFFGSALFVLVVSVMLAMRERAATKGTPPPPAAA